MKRIVLPTLALLFVPAVPTSQQAEKLPHAVRTKRPHQLSYTIITAGLKPPTLEGGRTEIEMGDVDGDGHVDLVSVGDHGSPFIGTDQHGIMVWFGDGQGGFAVQMNGNFGYGGVALGDVNGDGLVDVGYGVHHDYSGGDFGDQLLEVALGDGTGINWTPWDDGLATSGETWGMFGTDFGDVDGDGDLDVGSNSFGCCAGVHVYLNNGDGTWTQSFGNLGGNSDMDFVFVDFDGDGNLDAFTANDQAIAWRGDGLGGFTDAHGNLPANSYRGIDGGDVNGDGRDEVVFSGFSGGLMIYSWTPGDLWLSVSSGLPASGSFDLPQLFDMDLDGNLDVAAFGDGLLEIYLGDGQGTWIKTLSVDMPGSGSKNGAAFQVGGDFDHNGFPDITLIQEEGGGPFTGGTNTLYALLESSSPGSLSITPVAPGPGRAWRQGQVRFVDWLSGVPGTDYGSVSIDYSSTGPGGPWTNLVTAEPNDGRVQIVVPSGIDSSGCHLRYTATNAAGSATAVGPAFRIEP
ncbi:MAG: FG-GAP-like repeat-containing protein [Planctomycetota bacterium]|nr:FG-GAP-like repeat-containing protein [Planctomycetota bacterium]